MRKVEHPTKYANRLSIFGGRKLRPRTDMRYIHAPWFSDLKTAIITACLARSIMVYVRPSQLLISLTKAQLKAIRASSGFNKQAYD